MPRFVPDAFSARDLLVITAGNCSPGLSVVKQHSGNFIQGQTGVTYTLTVSNAPSDAATSGTVTVTDTLPGGLTARQLAATAGPVLLEPLPAREPMHLPAERAIHRLR